MLPLHTLVPSRGFRRSALLGLLVGLAVPASAQEFRNLVNVPFRTVASGPMSAHVVDVVRTRSASERAAVAEAVRAVRSRRDPGVARYVAALRRSMGSDVRMTPGVPDIVVLRRSGKLDMPSVGRTRAANELTFTFRPTGTAGGWTAAWESDLGAILSVVYAEMKLVYGAPAWSGSVTIVNGDSLPAGEVITDPNALSGGVYNVTTGEITIPQNLSVQSAVLNLTQMLAIAFHGPALLSYDPWERGMARAATLVVLRNAQAALQAKPSAVFGGTLGDLYVYDPLWHALDRYDWLNQPALGNDRFYPVSKTSAQANAAGFPNMLVPRLQMAGSAWLKVLTEAPTFLAAFNSAYYAALATDPGLRNRVPDLVQLATQALASIGTGTIEGLSFADWFARQYVLDSSVSPGPKLYAVPSALRPDGSDDDYAIGVILVYYRTGFDTLGNSDETDLNAVGYPIYRDYTFENRLFLGAQYERVDVRSGIGTVAPTFFNTIGGDPAQQGRMRITMDFALGAESARVEAAPRSSGAVSQPNNLWGVVVGADTGTLRLEADGISSGEVPVRQGAFGASVDPTLFTRPRRAMLTFRDTADNVTERRLITGVGEQVVVLPVESTVDTRTTMLPGGPAMVAFPIRPLQSRAADALRDPTTGAALFDDTTLLMAQWRQTSSGADKYARYPSLEPITPGKGYWMSLPKQTEARITGRLASRDRDVTVGLLYGWNQIGNPYETAIPTATLQFQYMADNVPVDLATAVTRGWVVAHTIPGIGQSAVWGYGSGSGYNPVTTLVPWTGYWIRVLVSEGLTMTYPSVVTKAARSAARREPRPPSRATAEGWAVRMTVTDPNGLGAGVLLGQRPGASRGRDPDADALAPPGFLPTMPTMAFQQSDWGAASGAYYSDIRGSGDRSAWRLTVGTPLPSGTYTLRWSLPGSLPRSLRLCLVDTATGRRVYMHTASSLAFDAGGASQRSFEIVPEVRGGSACRILNLRAEQSRAAGGRAVNVSFDLPTSASVSAQITDAGGRGVRRMTQGRAAAAGSTAMVWDARDDRGVAVPAGAYVLVVTARTTDGDVAKAALPLVLVR